MPLNTHGPASEAWKGMMSLLKGTVSDDEAQTSWMQEFADFTSLMTSIKRVGPARRPGECLYSQHSGGSGMQIFVS